MSKKSANATSQTNFGFTNLGSGVNTFRDMSFGKGKKSIIFGPNRAKIGAIVKSFYTPLVLSESSQYFTIKKFVKRSKSKFYNVLEFHDSMC